MSKDDVKKTGKSSVFSGSTETMPESRTARTQDSEELPQGHEKQPKDSENLPQDSGLSTMPESGHTLPGEAPTILEPSGRSVPVLDHIAVSGSVKAPVTENLSFADNIPVPGKIFEAKSIRAGEVMMGTYRIDSPAIQGGMGFVWRVHHIGWDVDLAMKRPKDAYFRSDKDKDIFTEECHNWINLGLHPNIVSCYYIRDIDGVPTIFSEWMDGGSVEKAITDGSLYRGSEKEVLLRLLDLSIQSARGLGYAHENRLIHQDVKPDNLLLTGAWEARVSDFGISKASSIFWYEPERSRPAAEYALDADKTQIAPSGGRTPAYCSPEQAEGQTLTRRTDIYSWAVSVMEMFLGGKPWANGRKLTGPIAGAACRIYFEMCPADRRIPERLQELLAQCMAADPDLRPHDFTVVEKELLEIYEAAAGRGYPRPQPKAAGDTADSLNNRALSMLDIGEPEEAVKYWYKALRKDPHHVDARFNMELHDLRTGSKFDYQTLEEMGQYEWIKDTGVVQAIEKEYPWLSRRLPDAIFAGRESALNNIHLDSAVLCGGQILFGGYISPADEAPSVNENKWGLGSMSKDGLGGDLEWDDLNSLTEQILASENEGDNKRTVPVCALYAPDGKTALVICSDDTLILYDPEKKELIARSAEIPNLRYACGSPLTTEEYEKKLSLERRKRLNKRWKNKIAKAGRPLSSDEQKAIRKRMQRALFLQSDKEIPEIRNERKFFFNPDKSMLAVALGDWVLLLSLPDLVQRACLEKTVCIGFLPDGRCLVRRRYITEPKTSPWKERFEENIDDEFDEIFDENEEETQFCESLVLVDFNPCLQTGADPLMEQVCCLGGVAEIAIEYLRGENLFLAYSVIDREKYFYLDHTFEEHYLSHRVFNAMLSVLYFDRQGLLCTGDKCANLTPELQRRRQNNFLDWNTEQEYTRVYFWQMDPGINEENTETVYSHSHLSSTEKTDGESLYTVKITNASEDKFTSLDRALFDEEKGQLLLWEAGARAIFQPLPLPSIPYTADRAGWKLSRIIATGDLLKQEELFSDYLIQFADCIKEGDIAGMVRIHEKCLNLPEYPGSRTAWEMESTLERMAKRDRISMIHLMVEKDSLVKLPSIPYTSKWVSCEGGLSASFNEDDPSKGVRIYGADGKKIRTISLPETALQVFVRKGRILVFGKKVDPAVYDLQGLPIDPAQKDPETYDPWCHNNVRKYGIPFPLEPDSTGKKILYAVTAPFTPGREIQERGIFQKDLQTGSVIRLADRYHKDARPVYLQDGSILIPPIPADKGWGEESALENPECCLRRMSGLDGHLIAEYRIRPGRISDNESCPVTINPERNLFLVQSGGSMNRQHSLFDMEKGLIFSWQETLSEPFFLPGGRYLCYRIYRESGSTDILQFWDIHEKAETYQIPYDIIGLLQPDPHGRELRANRFSDEELDTSRYIIHYTYKEM